MMGTVDPLSSASERFLGPSEQGSAMELGGGWDEGSRSPLSLLREAQEALLVVSDLVMELSIMGSCGAGIWASGELGHVNSRYSLIQNFWGGLQ